MHKKWKGYFTVEAAFILPMILFLYLIIILTALFLYCRSAISQDNFLLAMRAGRFTWAEDGYGEVIYGLEEDELWQAEDYVKKRMIFKKSAYPFFPTEYGECEINERNVLVQAKQRGTHDLIVKVVPRSNPIAIIREWRKNDNA